VSPNETKRPLFDLGQIVATPGALEAIQAADQQPHEFLVRHVTGDWGDLDQEDQSLNDDAVNDGSRILSAYVTRTNQRIYVITEATNGVGLRYCTTILLVSEY
jgi:hypothetical protein